MEDNQLKLEVHVNHNLDEVEAQLDRIIAKAEKANALLQQSTVSTNEAFLD